MTYCKNCSDSCGENTIKDNEQVTIRETMSEKRKSAKSENNVKYTQNQLMQEQTWILTHSLANQLILLLIKLLVCVLPVIHSQRCWSCPAPVPQRTAQPWDPGWTPSAHRWSDCPSEPDTSPPWTTESAPGSANAHPWWRGQRVKEVFYHSGLSNISPLEGIIDL